MFPKNGYSEWAALVVAFDSHGEIVLVYDMEKPAPVMWKIPGGKKEGNESPQETAIRELLEETGLKVDVNDLYLIEEVDKSSHRHPHTLFVFVTKVKDFNGLLRLGDEGEHVALFEMSNISQMGDFFPPHRRYIEEIYAKNLV